MITLTKEWLLKTIAELEEERDATPGAVNEDAANALAAMKLALASLEADSKLSDFVASQESLGVDFEGVLAENMEELYVPSKSTPPAPVSDLLLSELLGIAKRAAAEAEECAHAEFSDDSMRHSAAIADWERRAAMLLGAEPVTTAYKLRVAVEIIRNSGIEIDAEKIFAERDALNTPDCWCRTCRPVTVTDMRFVVCPECGNKRCPHANDHRNACTGSNAPGQEGSAYPVSPQQEVK